MILSHHYLSQARPGDVTTWATALVGVLEELSDEQIARKFDANFFGALEVIRAALPILRAQHGGHIVNISAAALISNYDGFSIYGAAKWALEGVSESLATN